MLEFKWFITTIYDGDDFSLWQVQISNACDTLQLFFVKRIERLTVANSAHFFSYSLKTEAEVRGLALGFFFDR